MLIKVSFHCILTEEQSAPRLGEKRRLFSGESISRVDEEGREEEREWQKMVYFLSKEKNQLSYNMFAFLPYFSWHLKKRILLYKHTSDH